MDNTLTPLIFFFSSRWNARYFNALQKLQVKDEVFELQSKMENVYTYILIYIQYSSVHIINLIFMYNESLKIPGENCGLVFSPSESKLYWAIPKSVFESLRTNLKNVLNLVRCKSVKNKFDSFWINTEL